MTRARLAQAAIGFHDERGGPRSRPADGLSVSRIRIRALPCGQTGREHRPWHGSAATTTCSCTIVGSGASFSEWSDTMPQRCFSYWPPFSLLVAGTGSRSVRRRRGRLSISEAEVEITALRSFHGGQGMGGVPPVRRPLAAARSSLKG